jgi:hypothetical protein
VDRLYRFEAQFSDLVPIGPVPEGLRLDAHFQGRVTDGELAGAAVRGVDYLLFRSDGVGVLDVRETLIGEGVSVEVRAGGYLIPPEGFSLPEPQVLLSPEFAWPDIELPFSGFATFRTPAPEWRRLNETVGIFTGAANPGVGSLVVDARALAPAGVSAR